MRYLQQTRHGARARFGHILPAPPYIIGDAQIDELVGKLPVAIGRALAAA